MNVGRREKEGNGASCRAVKVRMRNCVLMEMMLKGECCKKGINKWHPV